ncbi:MAG: hypothetical protein U0835_21910 [Isosphaeraceae bacterium]
MCLAVAVALGVLAGHARAGSDAPEAVSVEPAQVVLHGPRAVQHLVVSGRHGGALESDLTGRATFESLDPKVAAVSPSGLVSARGPGETTVVVRAAGRESPRRSAWSTSARAKYSPSTSAPRPSPRSAGAAATRGPATDRPRAGGFRLSLRGFDPDLDFVTLTREAAGRRTNVFSSEDSLILAKAAGRTPHQGACASAPTSRPTARCATGWRRGAGLRPRTGR